MEDDGAPGTRDTDPGGFEATLEFEFSEELAKKATRQRVLRAFGVWRALWYPVCLVMFILSLATEGRGWIAGAFSMYLLLMTVLWGQFFFRSMASFKRSVGRKTICRLSEQGLEVENDRGCARIPWGEVVRLWRLRDVWLLFISKDAYVPIPARQLQGEIAEFITRRVAERGGRVS